jgi:tRNA(His) guanylyltransferase
VKFIRTGAVTNRKLQMANYDSDTLGTRMKSYEVPSTSRKAFKGQPIVARFDGKNFHAFTRGLKRPYDERLSALMTEVTMFLVDRYQANAGYTQSDEITLVWFADSTSKTEYTFDGRFQKMDSLMAAACSVRFNKILAKYLPEKMDEEPTFDCRSFVVPNLLEAYHSILWRQQDCTKNAISMAAQSMFSHRSLQGQNSAQMQERMFAEKGINFNDYPSFFKRGTFARRVKVIKPLSIETMEKLNRLGRPILLEPIERSEVQVCNAWLQRLEDPIAFLFKSGPETYRAEVGNGEANGQLDMAD